MNPIIAIVGPTGVGKTKLAIHLAKIFQAELISADSRQVYSGMDIGTGKDVDQGKWTTINDRQTLIVDTIPIHGLNLTTPDQEFSIANWQAIVSQLISDIYQRGHRPIFVGGTGFYLDALQGKIQTLHLKPNLQLRQELVNLSREQLLTKLTQLSPTRAQQLNYSDQRNPARLIRAIEIASHNQPTNQRTSSYATLLTLIGLTMAKPLLLPKVDARIDQMIEQGLISEVENLIKQYGASSQAMTSIGYREIASFLNHHTTKDQAIQLIKTHTHQYIKRQYTWLNRQPVTWVDVSQSNWQTQAEDIAAHCV